MWRLLLSFGLTLGAPEGPVVQRPGDPVLWAFAWDAPEGCPSRESVVTSVLAYLPELEPPALGPSRADLRVTVEVSTDGSSWTAVVAMSGRNGASERRFSAPACTELADAVALISAVALDPVVVARGLNEAVAASPVESPKTPATEPRAERPEPDAALWDDNLDLVVSATDEPIPERSERDVKLGVGLSGNGGWGPTTAAFGGVAVSFAVFRDRWRWQLDGGYVFPRILSLDDGRRGRVQAWWLGTRGCLVPTLEPRSGAPVELPLCPGVEAGQVFARGLAPTTNTTTERQPWAAVVVGQGLRWPFIEQLALTVEAAVLISLIRGQFLIGDQTLTTLTPVGFRAALGLEARF